MPHSSHFNGYSLHLKYPWSIGIIIQTRYEQILLVEHLHDSQKVYYKPIITKQTFRRTNKGKKLNASLNHRPKSKYYFTQKLVNLDSLFMFIYHAQAKIMKANKYKWKIHFAKCATQRKKGVDQWTWGNLSDRPKSWTPTQSVPQQSEVTFQFWRSKTTIVCAEKLMPLEWGNSVHLTYTLPC